MFGLVIVILFITLEMLGLVINIPFIMIYYIRNVWPGYNYSIYYTYRLYCCYCDLMNFASLHTKSDYRKVITIIQPLVTTWTKAGCIQ